MATSDNVQKRLMAVGAHPDDMEYGAGATITKWIREGWEGCLVICTDGGKGTSDPNMDPQNLIATRAKEARAAAGALGIKDVVLLGYPDGDLENTRDLREHVVRQIRRFRPDVIFTFDPYRRSHNHRDHRSAGGATFDAVYPYARDYHHFPLLAKDEGLEPHIVGEIYAWTDEPDTWVDVTDSIDGKVAALREHKSQVSNPDGMLERITNRSKEEGAKAGMEFAEGFRRYQFRFPGQAPQPPSPSSAPRG
jgi:LmbE family N-acetylglucosaminyl deacetylase